MNKPEPPTIIVHGSRAIPLLLLAAAGCAIGAAIFVWLKQGNASRELGLIVAVAAIIGIFATKQAIFRPVQLVIEPRGIDVMSQQTGLLRWDELVHVSLFTIPPDGADGLAIFVDGTAARRLPPGHNDNLPAFADVSVGTKYIVLYGRELDCSLRDLLEEINARRRGQCGPLARRLN